jgi:hypothetical protein
VDDASLSMGFDLSLRKVALTIETKDFLSRRRRLDRVVCFLLNRFPCAALLNLPVLNQIMHVIAHLRIVICGVF